MTYQGGSVLLYFDAPKTDCTTIQKDVSRVGPPFNSSLTQIGRIDLAATNPLCLKSDFAANGVVIANQLVVLAQRGQGGTSGAAFCMAWVGHLGNG